MLLAERIRLAFRDPNGVAFNALSIDRFAPLPGKISAVAGPSGSGKTSLLYVVAGLLPPQEGAVTYDGMAVYAIGEGRRDAWRRKTIGFIFQDFHLIPELSVVGNVELPLTFGRGRGARAFDLLKELGVPLARRSVEQLSRGERQRVAIARALCFDPPIILADEPTASLDDIAAREVRAILRNLASDGRTVVVVTHDRAMLDEADTTVRLERGQLASSGERAGA